jgi:hypothetical protein
MNFKWKEKKILVKMELEHLNISEQKIKMTPPSPLQPQGLAVIFSHRQVYVKREGRTLFLLPKVKVEFRHLFLLQKRFSLCSYHNINANIVVFC